jgi:hypothetical protein
MMSHDQDVDLSGALERVRTGVDALDDLVMGEFDLAGLLVRVQHAVKQVNAKRVLDSSRAGSGLTSRPPGRTRCTACR